MNQTVPSHLNAHLIKAQGLRFNRGDAIVLTDGKRGVYLRSLPQGARYQHKVLVYNVSGFIRRMVMEIADGYIVRDQYVANDDYAYAFEYSLSMES